MKYHFDQNTNIHKFKKLPEKTIVLISGRIGASQRKGDRKPTPDNGYWLFSRFKLTTYALGGLAKNRDTPLPTHCQKGWVGGWGRWHCRRKGGAFSRGCILFRRETEVAFEFSSLLSGINKAFVLAVSFFSSGCFVLFYSRYSPVISFWPLLRETYSRFVRIWHVMRGIIGTRMLSHAVARKNVI